MTSFIAWVAVDSRAPASIYLASDSRISWDEHQTWNYGRKLYASKLYPEILGYVGDVLFPSQVLGQLIALIDSDLLFNKTDLSADKWRKIVSIVKLSFQDYPIKNSPFSIIYCTRERSGMMSIFHMYVLRWTDNKRWVNRQEIPLPEKSGIIDVLGSGEKTIQKWYAYWNRTTQGRTSRSIFSAFCDALASKEDKYSGGAPQLVGVYRKGSAESFGVIYCNNRYLFGLPVNESDSLCSVEWRNSLFERCDWRTMKLFVGAQRHSRPRGLGKAQ